MNISFNLPAARNDLIEKRLNPTETNKHDDLIRKIRLAPFRSRSEPISFPSLCIIKSEASGKQGFSFHPQTLLLLFTPTLLVDRSKPKRPKVFKKETLRKIPSFIFTREKQTMAFELKTLPNVRSYLTVRTFYNLPWEYGRSKRE